MYPLEITQALKETLISYLLTTFHINRDGRTPILYEELRTELSKLQSLINGPFLELSPPYVTGKTLEDLVDEGILDEALLQLACFINKNPLPIDAPLYTHQETAIRRISDGRSVIVSSGTGSGKTESFLIPILNDLLIDKTAGVRAVLIYPLNALVNDQLERLRNLLKDTDITFGRYTSELVNTYEQAEKELGLEHLESFPNEIVCRQQIREQGKLPQILITNYAMLEYLLLRPEDSKLFQQGLWRFIVLDEAHTYSGAMGIEVSYLIQRLKHRLGKIKGDIRCIATSATLTDSSQDAIQFAQNLFGEDFTEDDIIFGQPDKDYVPSNLIPTNYAPPFEAYLESDLGELIDDLRKGIDVSDGALQLNQLKLVSDDDLSIESPNLSSWLYETLSTNSHLSRLREYMLSLEPKPLVDVASHVFENEVDRSLEQRVVALQRLIELGAIARPFSDENSYPKSPLLPVRYHVFSRSPQGLWVCINPKCDARKGREDEEPWSKLFSTPHMNCDSCGCAVYEVMPCRVCGQIYLATWENSRHEFLSVQDGFSHKNYLLWSSIEQDVALSDTDEEAEDGQQEDISSTTNPQILPQEPMVLCLKCRKKGQKCTCEDKDCHVQIYVITIPPRTLHKPDEVDGIEYCCRCADKATGKGQEVVTSFKVSGDAPVSVLTRELYRNVPSSDKEAIRNKSGEGRKLLTFYDSRQGAARFASYLHDVYTQDVYRFLIPNVITQKGRPISFNRLIKNLIDEGWKKKVYQNDLNISLKSKNKDKPSEDDIDEIKEKIHPRFLAEITTKLYARQSLEQLGLLVVDYFEEKPDLSELARKVRMPEKATLTLIRQLLTLLRKEKVITLPDGVNSQDDRFGRNKAHNLVVKSKVGKGEIAWIGATTRHRRYQLVDKVLRDYESNPSEERIKNILADIWEWLIKQELLKPIKNQGYRIDHELLYFASPKDGWMKCTHCQRLYHDVEPRLCFHPKCTGRLEDIEIDHEMLGNYYYRVFNPQHDIVPLRVEEHTAQLSPQLGQEYQYKFKNGDINILSCSTTFEMGIDLGDLQAVVLNNVPPSVSNYRQRAGRAGRRTNGTAFILTWSADRPHDQQHFSEPAEIIKGYVRVPHILRENREILQRHINAFILSLFLHGRKIESEDTTRIDSFFDKQTPTPHYALLPKWLEDTRENLLKELTSFAGLLNLPNVSFSMELDNFKRKMAEENERYQKITDYYRDSRQKAIERAVKGEKTSDIQKEFERLLERFQKQRLIEYLSDRGVLPSYSFPLYTVELELPLDKANEDLRLQRDLSYAIREYAPGAEIIANKRLWRSDSLLFYQDTPKTFSYRICKHCNALYMPQESNVDVEAKRCTRCDKKLDEKAGGVYLKPDGFRADKSSGKPAGSTTTRQSLDIRFSMNIEKSDDAQSHGELLKTWYAREGNLFYVNEGWHGRGYRICKQCGKASFNFKKPEKNCLLCKGEIITVGLGHKRPTDTLQLIFSSHPWVVLPANDDLDFWYTMLYALIQGACSALQIERKDINGVLYPESDVNSWRQTIALYDNVPGGAGYVGEIRKNLDIVIRHALKIVNCPECDGESSCIHCLREYDNQYLYSHLKRNAVIPYLEALDADISKRQPHEPFKVSAINHHYWLIQQIKTANRHLFICADSIGDLSLDKPNEWIDTLRDLLRRDVEVHLFLHSLPDLNKPNVGDLMLIHELNALMNNINSLKVYKISEIPEWRILIDNRRAIRPINNTFILGDDGNIQLETTSYQDTIQQAIESFERIANTHLLPEYFAPPSNVEVVYLGRRTIEAVTDIDVIKRFFREPIKSITIFDPYLIDEDRLFIRLRMLLKPIHHTQKIRLTIHTKDAELNMKGGRERQNIAIKKLEKWCDEIDWQLIGVKRDYLDHDRWIEVIRHNEQRDKLIIGRGIDFIRGAGTLMIEPTYLIWQRNFA